MLDVMGEQSEDHRWNTCNDRANRGNVIQGKGNNAPQQWEIYFSCPAEQARQHTGGNTDHCFDTKVFLNVLSSTEHALKIRPLSLNNGFKPAAKHACLAKHEHQQNQHNK